MADSGHAALQVPANSLMNVGLAMMAGSLASLWLHGGAAPVVTARLLRDTARCFRLGAVLALAGSLAALWTESAVMADVPLPEAGGALKAVLAGSHYGHAWAAGVSALGLTAAISSRWRADGSRGASKIDGVKQHWPLFAGLAVYAASRSAVSHAIGANGWLPVVVDWLHLVLTSLWAGSVFLAGFVMLGDDAATTRDARLASARYVMALSSSATWSLVGVVLTGLFSAWRGLDGSPQALLTSTFGAALSVKLLFVAAAVALGGFNRFVVMPPLLASLHEPASLDAASLHRFVCILRLESIALIVAMLAAAVLTVTAPVSGG